jgi:HNH endonuclease
MDSQTDEAVRIRAGHRCEYCMLPQSVRRLRFQIDHVISRQHGGGDPLDNLALSCGRCNRHKGPNVAGFDSETGALSRLYHPRQDRWAEHFRWEGARILGLTVIGRVTVAVLAMNHADDVAVRLELLASGRLLPTSAQ